MTILKYHEWLIGVKLGLAWNKVSICPERIIEPNRGGSSAGHYRFEKWSLIINCLLKTKTICEGPKFFGFRITEFD